MNEITAQEVYHILKVNFPSQNDYNQSDYVEERNELLDFGINTTEKLQALIAKHKVKVLEIDSEDFDDFHLQAYTKQYGEEYMKDKITNRYWFAYPGLLRIVLELEFDEAYQTYADKRDGFI